MLGRLCRRVEQVQTGTIFGPILHNWPRSYRGYRYEHTNRTWKAPAKGIRGNIT
jgi:hypothetical protein